tara:strand:- start:437 stop:994 length:558 start_codon:yes stop_codon:yes gene_type:complete
MRIVSGNLKGKKIFYVKSINTRPLRDQVKESIFNIIDHSKLTEVKIRESKVLDLYSGTGSFGLECLSRGSKKVYFIEKDNFSYNTLEKNIKFTNMENKSNCFNLDVNTFLKRNKEKFDIIFLDPPFKSFDYLDAIRMIKDFLMYKEKNLIIIHRETKIKETFPDCLKIFKTNIYGRSKVIFGTVI